MILAVLFAPLNVFSENNGKKKTYVKPEFTLIMTNQLGGKAIDEFDCSDKVYVELTLPKISDKRHKIEAFWFDPDPFDSRGDGYYAKEFEGSHAHSWLKLPKEGLFGWGMEDFIGRWKVKIHLDGKFLGEKVFYIAC